MTCIFWSIRFVCCFSNLVALFCCAIFFLRLVLERCPQLLMTALKVK